MDTIKYTFEAIGAAFVVGVLGGVLIGGAMGAYQIVKAVVGW